MLHPTSFNPEIDTRLHRYYSNRIKKAFDPEYMEEEEPQTEAQKLMARLDNPSNQQA